MITLNGLCLAKKKPSNKVFSLFNCISQKYIVSSVKSILNKVTLRNTFNNSILCKASFKIISSFPDNQFKNNYQYSSKRAREELMNTKTLKI